MSLLILQMGDPSGDGHEKTEDVVVKANMSMADVVKAYEKGVRLVGVDLVNKVAAEYEDSSLPAKYIKKLKAAGFVFSQDDLENIEGNDGEYLGLYPDLFADLYLWIARRGNSELVTQRVELDTIDIGGYGLFY